jgi:hypothetical protein
MTGQPSDSRGPFFEDWQACLRAHYLYVVRARDAVTEPTLRAVLLNTGMTEHDLDVLLREAQALGSLNGEDELPSAEPASAAEELAIMTAGPDPDDDPSAELLIEAELDEPDEEVPPDEPSPPEPPPDAGRQLSLF